jgi:hypothetical protein
MNPVLIMPKMVVLIDLYVQTGSPAPTLAGTVAGGIQALLKGENITKTTVLTPLLKVFYHYK